MSARDVIAECLHDTSLDRMSTCLRRSDTILSALRSAGFAVVPVEPTEGMLRAYYQCMEGTHPTARMNPDKYLTHNLKANTRWRAMLKAAQEDSRE